MRRTVPIIIVCASLAAAASSALAGQHSRPGGTGETGIGVIAGGVTGGGATAGGATPTDATGPTGPTEPELPLAGKTITVDPGHNGANGRHPDTINRQVDAGGFRKACDTTGTTTADGRLSEAAFNWDVAKRLRKLLDADGAKVVFTRHTNNGVGPCINKRAQIGNAAKSDAAISIHADGGPSGGRGFHVIEPGSRSTARLRRESHKLALSVRRALLAAKLKTADYVGHNGIDRRSDLGGLNLSRVPKVLVELGNMQNSTEQRRLQSARWRQNAASAIAEALRRRLAG